MTRQLIIGDRIISDDSDCYVIAEIGHNHQGSLKTAIDLFKAAAECGVSAAKLQKRDNRALYTREMFNKPYENENSFGATYGEHREALEFGKIEYEELPPANLKGKEKPFRVFDVKRLAPSVQVPLVASAT